MMVTACMQMLLPVCTRCAWILDNACEHDEAVLPTLFASLGRGVDGDVAMA
jgi:hypothetical protein